MTDTDNTLSRSRRRYAHAAIDRTSPEDLASVAHNLVDDLADIIDAIARQAAAQTHHYINHARPSTSPPPSQETEAELLQERQVVAIEAIAKCMSKISSSFYTDFDGSALNVWVYKGEKQ